MSLKQKILKTIYYLSFIPYILFIIATICIIIYCVDFMSNYVTGSLIIIGLIALNCSPVLVACLIYQILFKVLTRNKVEYKQYNFKKFLLITGITIVIVIAVVIIFNSVSSLIYKYTYHVRGYSDINVVVVSYNDKYEDELNTTVHTDYDGLFEYITEHIDDLWKCIDTYQCNYTSYVICVSDVIDGSVEIIDKPELEISDGLKKSRITVNYSNDISVKEKNIIICITDSFSFEDYNTYTIWNEK